MKGATYKSGYYVLGAFALPLPSVGGLEDFMKKFEVVVAGKVAGCFSTREEAEQARKFYLICIPADCVWIRER